MGANTAKNELAASAEEQAQQYLTFVLRGEMFAIGIRNIKEIIEYGSLTEVPMMPEFIRGGSGRRRASAPEYAPTSFRAWARSMESSSSF